MSEPLWTLHDMANAMRAERAGTLPREVPGLSIDTRSRSSDDFEAATVDFGDPAVEPG